MKKTAPKEFVEYVMAFYGPGGVYDLELDLNPGKVAFATERYMEIAQDKFCGDSLDRERVREVLVWRFA